MVMEFTFSNTYCKVTRIIATMSILTGPMPFKRTII